MIARKNNNTATKVITLLMLLSIAGLRLTSAKCELIDGVGVTFPIADSEHPPLHLGPLRAAEQSQTSPGFRASTGRVGCGRLNRRKFAPDEFARVEPGARVAQAAGLVEQRRGTATSSRGSGGEPGRPFSLVTFVLGEQKESHRHRGRPPAMRGLATPRNERESQ